MNATTDPLVRDYLRTVERGLAPLPRSRREEVLADLREHLDASLAAAGTEADVRQVLERLGDPAAVAAAARAEEGVPAATRRPVMEWYAVFMVSAGSILLPFLGWLGGIAMVWSSSIFRLRHKVTATLLFPLGWVGTWLLFLELSDLPETCETVGRTTTCTEAWVSNPFLVAAFAVAVVGPFVSAVVLIRTLRRHRIATAL